jgi:integrase
MASGRTFKRCSCRDTETGRRLETKCPKLRRADGQWNPRHGSWSYQLELPPTLDGKRRNPLRRGGFTSQTAAEDDLGKAQELLAISNDRRIKNKITDFVLDTVKEMGELPDADTVRKKVRTGQQLNRNILLGDWLDIWLEGKKKIIETTKNRYASDVRLYLKPHLGHIPVAELRVADISEMFDAIEEYNELIREARASNNPTLRAKVKWRRVVNPPTLRNIRATLRHALNIAMKQERLIDFNPAAIVELPPATRPKPLVWTDERVRAWETAHRQHLTAVRERANGKRINVIEAYIGAPRPSPVMVWTPEQTARFLQRATRHRLYPLFRLIALRGLRRGEACGIQTTSVDLKAGTIAVCWQITQLGWNPFHGKPKSDAGDRIIDLDEETIKILRAHRALNRTASASPPGSGTRSSSSPTKTVTRSTSRTSPTSSNGWPTKPDCRPSACTTCATEPHPSCSPQASTSKSSSTPSAMSPAPSPATSTPASTPRSPATPPKTPPRSSHRTRPQLGSHERRLTDLAKGIE